MWLDEASGQQEKAADSYALHAYRPRDKESTLRSLSGPTAKAHSNGSSQGAHSYKGVGVSFRGRVVLQGGK